MLRSRERLARRESETLVFPAFDSANHFLDLPAKARQVGGCPICAIAVRPVAINNEKRVGWIRAQVSFVNLSVRQIGCAWDMAPLEGPRVTDIQQNEVGSTILRGFVNVPAICFEC